MEIDNCDHKGKWKPLGITGTSQMNQNMQYPEGGYVTSFRVAIYCENCGVIITKSA